MHSSWVVCCMMMVMVMVMAQVPNAPKQIYPTKTNGREWYLNEDSPCSDHMFSPGKSIKKYSGGGWQIDGQVRMGVNTLVSHANASNTRQWRDVEMTGYVYVIEKTHSSYGSHFSFYARGGKHTDCSGNLDCCDGSAYKGDLDVDEPGHVWVKKEVFHPKYTGKRGQGSTGATMMHKWVGWKVVIYNRNNDSVVVEGYIDKDANNDWKKAFTVHDNSSSKWSAGGEHKGCLNYMTGKQRGEADILGWAGPVATFRSDGLTWAFKQLSVREICALGSQAECAKQDHRPSGCHNMKMGDKCATQSCHVGEGDGEVPPQWW